MTHDRPSEVVVVAILHLISEEVQVYFRCTVVTSTCWLEEFYSVLGKVEQLFQIHDLVEMIAPGSFSPCKSHLAAITLRICLF